MSHPARGPAQRAGIDGKANETGRRRIWTCARGGGSEATE